MSFYLKWKKGALLLRGNDGTKWVDGPLTFPISFPGNTSDVQVITLQSSAQDNKTLENLTGLKLYLTGSDVTTVQEQWPYLGDDFTPARPDQNGGFEISFDNGHTFTRFSREVGYQSNPSTWIMVPAIAIGQNAIDGVLGPFDMANFTVRYVIPQQASLFKTLDINLQADFDII